MRLTLSCTTDKVICWVCVGVCDGAGVGMRVSVGVGWVWVWVGLCVGVCVGVGVGVGVSMGGCGCVGLVFWASHLLNSLSLAVEVQLCRTVL